MNRHVLIPRPETELLIERVLQRLQKEKQSTVIWDVGTGSGAIAITLAKEIPRAAILATDVSTRALSVARTNAKRLGVTRSVTFLKSNLLQPQAYSWLKRHSINPAPGALPSAPSLLITANLPYLPTSDKKKLAPDIAYEPSSALYAGPDGLLLINRFLRQLARHLPDWRYRNATVLLEFDPPQAATLKKIVQKLFPHASITIHRDLAGRNRVMEIISTDFQKNISPVTT
jgi:release factor glutamine methyltransferase